MIFSNVQLYKKDQSHHWKLTVQKTQRRAVFYVAYQEAAYQLPGREIEKLHLGPGSNRGPPTSQTRRRRRATEN